MTTISTLQATSALSVLTSAAAAYVAPSSVTVATATAGQVQISTTSGQASSAGHAALVASLKNQDTQSSNSADPQDIWDTRTLGEENAILRHNFSMTSAEASDAFYSGKGIDAGRGTMMQMSDAISEYSGEARAFADIGDTEISTLKQNQSDGIAAAFANHTLVIQSASDVPGMIASGSAEQYAGPEGSTDPAVTSGGFLLNLDMLAKLHSDNSSTTSYSSYNAGGTVFLLSWPKQ